MEVDVAAAVHRGVRMFNRGRYLSAQQVWEDAWHAAPAEDRGLLEGLVQLAAGLHLRTRRGGMKGAEHLVAQALVTLEDYQPDRHGVNVTALIADAGTYLDWVREIRRPHRLLDVRKLPRIR